VSVETARTLRVLSYNIWLRPPPFLDGQSSRARALPQQLNGHDVVVLCEAFRRSLSLKLFTDLAQAYPYQSHPTPPRDATDGSGTDGVRLWGGGVAILSRWPIEARARRSFSGVIGHPDSHANKGVLYARINKQGQRYHIFGTHTQSSPEGYVRAALRAVGQDAGARFQAYRDAQFDRMRAFIEEQEISRRDPVVIAGDLNTDRLHEPAAYEGMLQRLVAAEGPHEEGPSATFDPTRNPLATGERPQWIDYVLWSRQHLQPEESRVRVLPLRLERGWRRHPLGRTHHDLSDHYAVAAKLVFPAPAEELAT
jgi:endonuclease/exonuclease/phosphatase family metal-dependent hydrolase